MIALRANMKEERERKVKEVQENDGSWEAKRVSIHLTLQAKIYETDPSDR